MNTTICQYCCSRQLDTQDDRVVCLACCSFQNEGQDDPTDRLDGGDAEPAFTSCESVEDYDGFNEPDGV